MECTRALRDRLACPSQLLGWPDGSSCGIGALMGGYSLPVSPNLLARFNDHAARPPSRARRVFTVFLGIFMTVGVWIGGAP